VIAHLRGSILEKHPNRIVIDVNGVGYDIFVPLSTFYGLGDAGSATALRIHTHVREDAIVLFGFLDPAEKTLFIFMKTAGATEHVVVAVPDLSKASVAAAVRAQHSKTFLGACSAGSGYLLFFK